MYLREGKYVNAKDLYLLSLAETVHADYILTGDKDLTRAEEFREHLCETPLPIAFGFHLHPEIRGAEK